MSDTKSKGGRPGASFLSNTRQSRRDFIKATGTMLATTAAHSAGLMAPAQLFASPLAGKEITIGTYGPSHCSTSFVYSSLQGLFKKAGLKVNLVNYPAMPLIAKDLISGKLDFGQLIVPLVFAIHTGKNPFNTTMPMAICQIAGTNGAALMVGKNAGIGSPMDFRGKKMANHSKLSVHYLINMMFLENYGLDYQKDVDFQVIKLENILDSMKTGEIDTFVMPEPKNAVVEAQGIGDLFLLSKYIWPNHPCCSLVTRKEFMDSNRQLVTDVTRVMTTTALTVNQADTREETVDILRSSSKYKYDTVPRQVLLKAFTPGRSDFYPFPFQSQARVIIEIMKKYDLLPQEIDDQKLAREVFQSDMVRNIMLEIGAKPPESDYRFEKILGKLKDYSV